MQDYACVAIATAADYNFSLHLQAEVDAMLTDDPKAAISTDTAVKVSTMPAPAIQEAKQVILNSINQQLCHAV